MLLLKSEQRQGTREALLLARATRSSVYSTLWLVLGLLDIRLRGVHGAV